MIDFGFDMETIPDQSADALEKCRTNLKPPGTMDEMKRATEVFGEVLGISATDDAAGAGSN